MWRQELNVFLKDNLQWYADVSYRYSFIPGASSDGQLLCCCVHLFMRASSVKIVSGWTHHETCFYKSLI